jgi:hypothetical protein
MAKEDEIKLIAYNIWEEEGCVEGRDCEHWYRAELIWQQQQQKQPKAAAGISKSAPKQIPSQGSTVMAAKKKPNRK